MTALGFAFLVVAVTILLLTGGIFLTPQYKYYIAPATWNQPAPYPPGSSSTTNAQWPPVYAILHFYPNGSATAEAWVYDPNTVPIKVTEFWIDPVFTTNNTPQWWGLTGTPANSSYPAGVQYGEVLPFTFAYTNEWTAEYPEHTYPPNTLIPPGMLVNSSGNEYFAFSVYAISPLGSFSFYEPFVYVGNGTWVATPGTAYLDGLNGKWDFVAWQVWPQEIPPGWPYPNLVNVTSAPLPPWWGQSSIPPTIP
ncbi:hypothetical protein NAS2_1039 [Conexivisphaera calida]|uniref:Uncharacterized protein n=1 Tax=Conexivisphaera calida TaxID=1874277 RepID=A0A4P2VN98_9ARCH|nr:hypothetical protein NAS2_1039 [Conexivisphaera calida]